jgi:DNA-binding transcriptional regulator YiaG
MRIPEIRSRLQALALEHNLPELAKLAEELRRRRVAGQKSTDCYRMTPELRAAIQKALRDNPSMSQYEIAVAFNVNPGRVSEIATGYRQ